MPATQRRDNRPQSGRNSRPFFAAILAGLVIVGPVGGRTETAPGLRPGQRRPETSR